MADSCRPVSRHGRYSSSGPSSMEYSGDVASYGGVDYTPSDEMYTVNQPAERPERPRTSRGHRRRNGPGRPVSRQSRQETRDEESSGRPMSRVGMSPESSYRYSHDEFSRQQASSDNERQIQNSPCDSPEILYRDDEYFNNQKALLSQSPQQQPSVDRLIVSPTGPSDLLGGRTSQKSRKSPQSMNRKSPYGYGQSPQGYSQSPQGGYRQSPHGYRQSPQFESQQNRPSSREYINVSPLQRDEAQLDDQDLHHAPRGHYDTENPYMNEGDAYQQRFTENSQYRNSPYQDYRDSPSQARDSPYYSSSPVGKGYGQYGSPEGHTRPPPAPRPKSARPKTGRKKSARVRQQQRYQEQETSPPQHCDTTSILNAGDPYGRPSSSLSPYKPLPAIGTPRDGDPSHHDEQIHHGTRRSGSRGGISNVHNDEGDHVTVKTQKLSLIDKDAFHPADDDTDIFSAEDIQSAPRENLRQYAGSGIPDVEVLSNFPQHLSQEIYQSSVANFEQNIADDRYNTIANMSSAEKHGEEVDVNAGSENQIDANDNGNNYNVLNLSPNTPKPLDFLHEIPDEPTEGEPRLLLAIKLPDGRRIQRLFSPDSSLISVMYFAENTSLESYEDYHLICNAPRTIFTDLEVRIGDTQIKDRTVLYLEETE